MFKFSTLASASATATGFDAAIVKDAQAGRINHTLATVLYVGYGLPAMRTVKGQLSAVNKPALLALRAAYADDAQRSDIIKSARKARKERAKGDELASHPTLGAEALALIGAALDALGAALEGGKGGAAPLIVGDATAWAAKIEAAKPPKKDKPEEAPVNADKASESASRKEATKPGPPVVTQGVQGLASAAPAPAPAPAPEVDEGQVIDSDTLFDTVCAAIRAGAFDLLELSILASLAVEQQAKQRDTAPMLAGIVAPVADVAPGEVVADVVGEVNASELAPL